MSLNMFLNKFFSKWWVRILIGMIFGFWMAQLLYTSVLRDTDPLVKVDFVTTVPTVMPITTPVPTPVPTAAPVVFRWAELGYSLHIGLVDAGWMYRIEDIETGYFCFLNPRGGIQCFKTER